MFNDTGKRIGKALLLLGGVAFLSGCVADDRTDCRFPLRLEFRQASLRPETPETTEPVAWTRSAVLDSEVESLSLYLYDRATGAFVAEVEPTVQGEHQTTDYTWPVPPGVYRLVAWGGHGERYTASATELLEGALLETQRAEDGSTVLQQQGHLFYGVLDSVSVTGDYLPAQVVELYKKSKNVRVEVVGLTQQARERLMCSIEAPSVFKFDNTVSAEHDAATFLPEDVAHETRAVKLFTLPALAAGDGSLLHLELAGNEASQATTIYDGSLTELIQSNPQANLAWDEEFNIRVNIYGETADGESHMDILVNDYVVIHQEVVLK